MDSEYLPRRTGWRLEGGKQPDHRPPHGHEACAVAQQALDAMGEVARHSRASPASLQQSRRAHSTCKPPLLHPHPPPPLRAPAIAQ
eukprot:3141141-Rhodomonas_salina.1